MINAIIVGAAGRMGRMIVNAIQNAEGITCTVALETSGHPVLGQDAGIVAGVGELGVTIQDKLKSVIQKGNVVIDFTSAEASLGNMEIAAQHHKPMVVGSTGFSSQQLETVRKLTNETCDLIVRNQRTTRAVPGTNEAQCHGSTIHRFDRHGQRELAIRRLRLRPSAQRFEHRVPPEPKRWVLHPSVDDAT